MRRIKRRPTRNTLTLIRGVPGSGKTTKAQQLLKYDRDLCHFEADMYFTTDGVYTFNPRLLGEAHAWCLKETRKALSKGLDVVVSNTFSHRWELNPYLEAAVDFNADVKYIICTGHFKNTHNVPEEVVERMRAEFAMELDNGYT